MSTELSSPSALSKKSLSPPSIGRTNAFQKLAISTTAITYLLILVGGLVRASGAGMGCPDWPKCFGLYIPPLSAAQLPPQYDPALFNVVHTWTEYINRLLGALTGIFIFATLIAAVMVFIRKEHPHRRSILLGTVSAFILVGYAGFLGGRVVKMGLEPWMVTAHLVVAILVVSSLLFATLRSLQLPVHVAKPRVTGISITLIALTLFQVGLGTQVRAAVEYQKRLLGGVERSAWLDAVGGIDVLHRQASLAVFALSVFVAYRLFKTLRGTTAQKAAFLSLGLVIVQIAAGVGLAYLALPPILQIVHLIVGSLLLGAQSVVVLTSR